jgi:hypothetical protein
MSGPRRVPRLAGRFIGSAVIARGVKRYPIAGIGLILFRWWRRRRMHVDRTTVRLHNDEILTVRNRRTW